MRASLLIIFLTLWKFNTDICNYYYDYSIDFSEWYYLRCDIYEVMFLVAIIIPWFKSTLFSRGVMLFGLVLIAASVIDKVFINDYALTDKFYFVIVPFAVSSGYIFYEKRNNK